MPLYGPVRQFTALLSSGTVITQLERGNFFNETITKNHLFASVHDAITYIARNREQSMPHIDAVSNLFLLNSEKMTPRRDLASLVDCLGAILPPGTSLETAELNYSLSLMISLYFHAIPVLLFFFFSKLQDLYFIQPCKGKTVIRVLR